jgi:hypothetical protein
MKTIIESVRNNTDSVERNYREEDLLQCNILFTTYPSWNVLGPKHSPSPSGDCYVHLEPRNGLLRSKGTVIDVYS